LAARHLRANSANSEDEKVIRTSASTPTFMDYQTPIVPFDPDSPRSPGKSSVPSSPSSETSEEMRYRLPLQKESALPMPVPVPSMPYVTA
jgi:hypothetical protein